MDEIRPVRWDDGRVVLLDQTLLPGEEIYKTYEQPEDVATAIRDMLVRGAPAIGIAAAMGIALGVQDAKAADTEALVARVDELGAMMGKTRPTAVNLFWAIERMGRVARAGRDLGVDGLRGRLVEEAQVILDEDIAANRAMGRHGAALLPDECTVLTHCNAGALATGGYGTALGIVRAAVEMGKKVRVFADETRPFLQGARLTAWELQRDGIETILITDNMAGHYLHEGEIDAVIVGTDRTVANGDVANKIGTYGVAVLARENGVPFYVAAPTSTVDLSISYGDDIEIEQRSADEVVRIGTHRIAPEGIGVRHPAFDVTPHRYVTAIVTERGVARPPYRQTLPALMENSDG